MYQYRCKQCGAAFESNRRGRMYCSRACQNRANNDKAEERLLQKELIQAWSCGGGVDSTAVAALIVAGLLPKPDIAYMTDCGWEEEGTWHHVRTVLMPRLLKVGVELHVIDVTESTDTSALVDAKGNVLVPAYSLHEGEPVRYRTHCNSGWKVNPARRWLRAQGVERCSNWIGITTDEARRQRASPLKWCQNRYPLIELGMSRADCLYFLGAHGWPMPPQTSCIICPQRSDAQWERLRQTPRDWQRAVAAEQQLRSVRPDVFLHRSLVPLSDVRF